MLCAVVFYALGYILFPLYALVKESLTGNGQFSVEPYRQFFRSSLLEASINSIVISFLSVLGSAAVGTFLAYVFAFFEFPAKSFFSKLVLVPLALPPLVGVISFLFLVGESGMLSRLLSLVTGTSPSWFTVNGWTGIVLVHVYSFYVYFFLFVSSGLMQLDGNALDASASLGATRMRTIFRVLLPMLTPSLVGASLITFMSSMASFSAPFLFGGATRYLTLEIYTAKLNGESSSAAALSILLLIVSVCAFLFLRWWQTRKHYLLGSKGALKVSVLAHRKFTRTLIICSALVLILIFTLPIMTIVAISFVKEGSWTYQIFPTSFTAKNYLRVIEEPRLLDPLLNSIRMALVATAGAVCFGVAASYLVNRKRFSGRRPLEIILSLPFGIPGTVIAVGLILGFNRPSLFSFNSILVGTFWIMPVAYIVRNLPLLFRSISAGFETITPSLYEAAETLGSTQVRTFRKVMLPLLVPSIVSGALLVFVNSAGEFVSSILLYSYSTKPVSVEILSQLRLFDVGAAAMYSTLLMLIVLGVVAISQRFFKSIIAM